MAASTSDTLPRWQRSLLPAVLGAGPADEATRRHLRRSPRDWLVDVVMFVLSVALGLAALHTNVQHSAVALTVVDIVLGLVACLSLWVRRRRPLAVGWLTVVASAVSGLAAGASVAGLFTVAVHCPPRRTAQVAGASLIASLVYTLLYRSDHTNPWNGIAFGLFFTIVAVGYGMFVRVQRQLVLSLHERSQRLEAEQHLHVQEARHAERTRIAREMHDVLAHRISLLSVHAGALEFNPGASPDEIAHAAGIIRTSARAAQEELREVIGVLRDEGDPDSASRPPQPPQPTLADLPELVDESRRAGMAIAATIELAPDVPIRLGRAVYRLVQEALTNARKHAPGQRVTLAVTGDRVRGARVEVVNRPAVGHAAAPASADGSGTGLIGLGERVALVGGRLEHERMADGGFRLVATLPWGEPE